MKAVSGLTGLLSVVALSFLVISGACAGEEVTDNGPGNAAANGDNGTENGLPDNGDDHTGNGSNGNGSE